MSIISVKVSKDAPKLPPGVKAKWLDALRGGKYKQARGRLKQVDPNEAEYGGFCCLGVLYDVVGVGRGCGLWRKDGQTFATHDCVLTSEDLPPKTYRALDATLNFVARDTDGTKTNGCETVQEFLIRMNDGSSTKNSSALYYSTRKTFKQIAKWIEKNL